MTDKKLIPFDLKRALAGDKVVTREGQEVQQLFYFDKANEQQHRLIAVVGDEWFAYPDNGSASRFAETPVDLFMIPKTKFVFVGIEKLSTTSSIDGEKFYRTSDAYENLSVLEEKYKDYFKFKIEIEE